MLLKVLSRKVITSLMYFILVKSTLYLVVSICFGKNGYVKRTIFYFFCMLPKCQPLATASTATRADIPLIP